MKGQLEKKQTLCNANFLRSKGRKHAGEHEKHTVAAEAGLLTDTLRQAAAA